MFPFSLHHSAQVVCLVLCLSACAALDSQEPLPTASAVDLSRYMGKWYEIARLPMWAQRKCVTSTAEYRLLDSGDVGVRNACVTTAGDSISIDGVATVVDREQRAKLNVVFDQWAARLVAWLTSSEHGNYWILRIDPDYHWVVVGTPDREYLWILSRNPALAESTYQELLAFSRQLGFPTERLIRAPIVK
jgi:apolipoprotein D and lipocalin family protein